MSDYIPTEWVNEVPNGLPLRYKITDVDGTVIAQGAVIELLNAVTPGTPVDATRMNKIEQGIRRAQQTANQAVNAADAAQGTANQAKNAAAAAQSSANSGLAAASAAQSAANLAAGAAAAAQSTANTAVANAAAAQSTANSAAASAAAALAAANARKPLTGYAERTSEYSTSSKEFVDVPSLSVTINLPAAGTIIAWCSGSHRAAEVYSASNIRLVIDGTASGVTALKSCNDSNTDISWVPFSLVYRKAVAAGSRTVKVQMQQSGAGSGTIHMLTGNLFVIAFLD